MSVPKKQVEIMPNMMKSLPKVDFNRQTIQNMIDKISADNKIKEETRAYLDNVEAKISEIKKYLSEGYVEDYYSSMQTSILEIRNITNALYELLKPYHLNLPNAIKQRILDWIMPLEDELKERTEISKEEKERLELNTKHLYAEQSFIVRTPHLKKILNDHLVVLKKLLSESDKSELCCYISYAWSSQKNQEHEYWVQPFLSILYDHLSSVGIRVKIDIRDNKPGDSIFRYMEQFHLGDHVILVGTESLLQKHRSNTTHTVQTELSIISGRYEQDIKQFGHSRIYPMLISGTIKTSYPEIYDKYRAVVDARIGYVECLRKIIDWLYDFRIKKIEMNYIQLWKSFKANNIALPKENICIEQELSLGYHRQSLDFLRQNIQYQSVSAQQEIKHSSAVNAEMIGVLMRSQGSNPKTLFDEHGIQFQRPYSNPNFIERGDLQEKIIKHFSEADQQILTLTAHGLGGVGKTELAQYFYLNPLRPYALRAWFYAFTRENLYQQYIDFGVELGIEFVSNASVEEKVKKVKCWLESQKDCLLIYDNVSGPNVIEGLLPERGKHHILMTSRNSVDWPLRQKLDVDVMEEKEAILLIRRITGIQGNEEKVRDLVNILGKLPLALAQAGAYISVKSLSLDEYLVLYKEFQAKVLTEETKVGPKHEPVWITFNMNFNALRNECPPALTTLKQAGWLSSTSIPQALFTNMLDSTQNDPKLLWADIKESIKRYSLMRIDSETHLLSIHTLVQDIIRSQQTSIEQLNIYKQVCDTLNNLSIYYDEKGNLEFKSLLSSAERLHEHALNTITKLVSEEENKVRILLKAEPASLGDIYYKLRLTSNSLKFYENQLKIYEEHYGSNHVKIAASLNDLSNIYNYLGNSAKQKELLERSLRILSLHYGPTHVLFAITASNLARAYGELGNSTKKREILEECLTVLEGFFGKEHMRLVTILNDLSCAYKELGNTLKQKELLERALFILDKNCDPNHMMRATVLSNLGFSYGDLGDAAKQKELLECALRICKQHYDKEHVEIAHIYERLGVAYGELGDVKKKKELIEQALPILERHYGKEHPEVAKVLSNLGVTYEELGSPNKRKEIFERVLLIQEKHYGPEHVIVATTLSNLGNACGDLKDYNKQKILNERALKIFEKFYGPNHEEVAVTLDNLACVYQRLGNIPEARKLLERAEKICMLKFPFGHPSLTHIQDNLNTLDSELDEPQSLDSPLRLIADIKAEKKVCEEILTLQENEGLHENISEKLINYINLGIYNVALDQYAEAKEKFELAYSIQISFENSNSWISKIICSWLAFISALLNEFSKAKDFSLSIKEIVNDNFKPLDSKKFPLCDDILTLLLNAIHFYKDAREVLKAYYLSEHFYILTTYMKGERDPITQKALSLWQECSKEALKGFFKIFSALNRSSHSMGNLPEASSTLTNQTVTSSNQGLVFSRYSPPLRDNTQNRQQGNKSTEIKKSI